MRLIFDTELVAIREIISRRVAAEVGSYNRKAGSRFRGLVEPVAAEKMLNGKGRQNRQPVNAEKQIAVALAAFEQNGFFILVDNKQFDRLEDEIIVAKTTAISFIKLTPLVGVNHGSSPKSAPCWQVLQRKSLTQSQLMLAQQRRTPLLNK